MVLPLYYGLAFLVDEAWLADCPDVTAVLDHLESADGRRELIELGEKIRLRSMVTQHAVLTKRDASIDRLRRRYLETVISALVNDFYLEDEIRLVHLLRCAAAAVHRNVQAAAVRRRGGWPRRAAHSAAARCARA